jgi:hypothetical protein
MSSEDLLYNMNSGTGAIPSDGSLVPVPAIQGEVIAAEQTIFPLIYGTEII